MKRRPEGGGLPACFCYKRKERTGEMAKIRINGIEYDLRMSLWASEQIENEFGDLKGALQAFRKERKISMVRKMFVIMANAGRKRAKLPTDVPEDALDNCTLMDLDRVATAMSEAMDETAHAETIGGNEADDAPRDALAEEYDEKNA